MASMAGIKKNNSGLQSVCLNLLACDTVVRILNLLDIAAYQRCFYYDHLSY